MNVISEQHKSCEAPCCQISGHDQTSEIVKGHCCGEKEETNTCDCRIKQDTDPSEVVIPARNFEFPQRTLITALPPESISNIVLVFGLSIPRIVDDDDLYFIEVERINSGRSPPVV